MAKRIEGLNAGTAVAVDGNGDTGLECVIRTHRLAGGKWEWSVVFEGREKPFSDKRKFTTFSRCLSAAVKSAKSTREYLSQE